MESLYSLGFYPFHPVTTSFVRFVPRFGLLLRLLVLRFRFFCALLCLLVYLAITRVWGLAFFVFFVFVHLSYYPLLYILFVHQGVDPDHTLFIGRWYLSLPTYLLRWHLS